MNNLFTDSTDENEVKDEQEDPGYGQFVEEEPQLISDAVKQFETDQSGQQRYDICDYLHSGLTYFAFHS